jgi:hypothetical protein
MPIEGLPDNICSYLLSLEDTQTWEQSSSGFEDCTTAKFQELTSIYARLVKDLQGYTRTTTRELSAYTTILSNLLQPLILQQKADDKFFEEDIVELPPIHIKIYTCPLKPEYQLYIDTLVQDTEKEVHDKLQEQIEK